MKLTGPGGTDITGAVEGTTAVFRFGTVSIPAGATINATGSRPFKIVASGNFTLGGVINASGSTPANFQIGPITPGAGGGSGGSVLPNSGGGSGGGGGSTSNVNGAGVAASAARAPAEASTTAVRTPSPAAPTAT